MQRKIKTFIDNQHLLYDGDVVIVGVSGGVDSVVLLQLLHALRYKAVVAHCNFSLRADESDRDEAFVRALAQQLSLPLECVRFDTQAVAAHRKISIEMAARDLRYEWFETLRQKHSAAAIAVAHHADDNIETVLMNLVRGTGLRGITGIKARNGNIIRPMLCFSRTEIEQYADVHFLNYVTDSSNATNDYTRNKFRNQLIPTLEEINPAFRKVFGDNIAHFNQQYEFYRNAIDVLKQQIVRQMDTHVEINIAALCNCASPSLVLFEILQDYNFDADIANQLYESINGNSGRMFLSHTHTALLDRNSIILKPTMVKNASESFSFLNEEAKHTQPFRFEICVYNRTYDFKPSKKHDLLHLDADKLGSNLSIEKWQLGDSFVPFGMNGRKKVSDYLIDNKLNRFEKENIWVLKAENAEIAWLIGFRSDQRFCVDEKTTKITEIKLLGD